MKDAIRSSDDTIHQQVGEILHGDKSLWRCLIRVASSSLMLEINRSSRIPWKKSKRSARIKLHSEKNKVQSNGSGNDVYLNQLIRGVYEHGECDEHVARACWNLPRILTAGWDWRDIWVSYDSPSSSSLIFTLEGWRGELDSWKCAQVTHSSSRCRRLVLSSTALYLCRRPRHR